MMGMRLLEMEATDALDVIHVLFEEDHAAVTPEHHQNKMRVRKVVYSDFYEMSNAETRAPDPQKGTTDADGHTAAGPAAQETKPYVPPTDPNQLVAVLGPPMG